MPRRRDNETDTWLKNLQEVVKSHLFYSYSCPEAINAGKGG